MPTLRLRLTELHSREVELLAVVEGAAAEYEAEVE
jgi:hypothetical protein